MPTARYFRLKIIKNKPSYEISSIQLFNDNTRVDEIATITSGFETDTNKLNVLKNNVPDNTSFVGIGSSLVNYSTLYFIWSFASATNVNAFKIGSGSSEDTYLNQFLLEISTDGLSFKPFILIKGGKKLKFPGAWTLSELKPFGEAFPALLEPGNLPSYNANIYNGIVQVLPDGRSLFAQTRERENDSYYNGYDAFQIIDIPGFHTTKKYYIESTVANYHDFISTTIWLVAVKNPLENKLQFIKAGDMTSRVGFSLNNRYLAYSTTYTGAPTTFNGEKKNVTQGLCFDLITRDFFIHNAEYVVEPKLTSTILSGNFDSDNVTTDKYKFFILIWGGFSSRNVSKIDINFGQRPFIRNPPAGISTLGTRWEEDLNPNNDLIPIDFGFSFSRSEFTNIEPVLSKDVEPILKNITLSDYYIKGSITRTPDIQNKKFKAILIKNEDGTTISTSFVAPDGTYEFFGIPYEAYTVVSVDLRSNTVSETIGPIYPLEIV